MLETLRLVVHLVPAVTEHLHQEHFQEAVMAHELEGDLATLSGELLPAVAIVFHEALGGEAGDHLADRGRGDAEALRQLARGDWTLVAMQLVEGLEVILLRAGESATTDELDHLGSPNPNHGCAYHER